MPTLSLMIKMSVYMQIGKRENALKSLGWFITIKMISTILSVKVLN